MRFRIWAALAVGTIVAGLLCAQVSEEQESRRGQSKSDETHATPSPKPKKSPSPAAKKATSKSTKKHRPSATPEKAPKAIPRAKLVGEESEKPTEAEKTPNPTPRETPKPSASPKSKRHHTPTPKPRSAKKKSHEKETGHKTGKTTKLPRKEEETPKPRKTPTPRAEEERAVMPEKPPPPPPRAVAVPIPAPCPTPKIPRAVPSEQRDQVVIEKSGIEEDQGFEPPPSPPPRRFGFWPWSRPTNYRYLTSSVIDAIRRAPVKRRRWQFIVVHNSGTRQGNARAFDYYHRHVRRMQNGLAYHFVIGNGTSTGNGQIEVGDRWRRQINGGHVHSDYLNNISLGICLVGDFNRDQPTRAQLDACEELIRYLRERCGGTGRGAIPVKPHREINPPRWPTDCPGDVFPYSWFRRF
ncbi:MAG: N-acetylmuramoyl-L-alanine amidase [Candidatus Udaeobacter sp.]